MNRRALLLPLIALPMLLAGCSSTPSTASAAEKCGGNPAGITVSTDGVLEYDQSADDTGEAWQCLLSELVTDKADQYVITQGLDESLGAQDGQFGELTAVWALNGSRGIQLSFWPTITD